VVESYLESGAPVGSRTLSKVGGLNLSPASIRNVMQDLEEAGLLAAPHTSAGGCPPKAGLRLFVDGMMQAAEPTADERRAIEARDSKAGPIESALAASDRRAVRTFPPAPGVVMVPKREPRLRQFSLCRCRPGRRLRYWSARMAPSKTGWWRYPLGRRRARWPKRETISAPGLAGLTLAEALARLDAEIRGQKARSTAASRDLVRGLAVWSEDANDARC
jgi:heat-inducible transcriptional repressor